MFSSQKGILFRTLQSPHSSTIWPENISDQLFTPFAVMLKFWHWKRSYNPELETFELQHETYLSHVVLKACKEILQVFFEDFKTCTDTCSVRSGSMPMEIYIAC